MKKEKEKEKKKKVRKPKPTYEGITFDSTLEIYCYKQLKANNIKFEYQPKQFELFEKFEANIDSYEPDERKGDLIYKRTNKYQNVGYTPDFVGKDWIIETKGRLLPKDGLIIKLFKRYLLSGKKKYKNYYMPKNHKQVDECIRLILEENE